MQKEEYWRRREEEERWRMEMRSASIVFLFVLLVWLLFRCYMIFILMCESVTCDYHVFISRRYEEDMYWRRMEEEQHHWDERRRMPDGGFLQGPPGPPGLLGVRPGMPIPQPQGPVVSSLPLRRFIGKCLRFHSCKQIDNLWKPQIYTFFISTLLHYKCIVVLLVLVNLKFFVKAT